MKRDCHKLWRKLSIVTPPGNAPLQQQEPGLRSSSSSMDSYMRNSRSDEFLCNICKERATDSVVSPCGHIFCWSCLYRWLNDKAKPCPLCNAMVRLGSIIPVHGGRTRRSRESSIPPRPTGRADVAEDGNIVLSPAFREEEHCTVTVSWSWMRETQRRSSHLGGLMRDAHLQRSRSIALEKFRAIRESRPPSSIGWIAEASGSFDPSVRSGDGARLRHDLRTFVLYVLSPQCEYFPADVDFRKSWWPYYKALNPWGLFHESFADFTESWCKHFLNAWDRAGCPEYPASPGGPRLPITGSDDGSDDSVDEVNELIRQNN